MKKTSKRQIRSQNEHYCDQMTSYNLGNMHRKIRSQLDCTKVDQKNNTNALVLSDDNFAYVFHKNNNYSIKVKHGRKGVFHQLFVFLKWYFFCFEVLLEEYAIGEDIFLLGDIEIPISDNIYKLSEKEKEDFLKSIISNFFKGQQLSLAELFAKIYVKNNMDFLVEYALLNEVIGINVTFSEEPINKCLMRLETDILHEFLEESKRIDGECQTQGFKQMRNSILRVLYFIIAICVLDNNESIFFDFDKTSFDTPFELVLYYIHEFEFKRKHYNLRDAKFEQIINKFNRINTNPILKDWMTYYQLRREFSLFPSDSMAKEYVNAVSRLKHLPYMLCAGSSTITHYTNDGNIIHYSNDGKKNYIQSDIKLPVSYVPASDLSIIELYLYHHIRGFEVRFFDAIIFEKDSFKIAFNYSKEFDDYSYLIKLN